MFCIWLYYITYWGKLCMGKVIKFSFSDENFPGRKFSLTKNFNQQIILSDEFYLRNNFLRRKCIQSQKPVKRNNFLRIRMKEFVMVQKLKVWLCLFNKQFLLNLNKKKKNYLCVFFFFFFFFLNVYRHKNSRISCRFHLRTSNSSITWTFRIF